VYSVQKDLSFCSIHRNICVFPRAYAWSVSHFKKSAIQKIYLMGHALYAYDNVEFSSFSNSWDVGQYNFNHTYVLIYGLATKNVSALSYNLRFLGIICIYINTFGVVTSIIILDRLHTLAVVRDWRISVINLGNISVHKPACTCAKIPAGGAVLQERTMLILFS